MFPRARQSAVSAAVVVACGIGALVAPGVASALGVQRVTGYPGRCEGALGVSTSDGSLWLVCHQVGKWAGGILHVTPSGRVSGPLRPPVDPYNTNRVGSPSWNVAEAAAGPDGSFWFTDGSGNVCAITSANKMRCATTPTGKRSPRTTMTTAIAEGSEGDMWVTQGVGSNGGAPSGAMIVRVTPELAMTEYAAPFGWNNVAGLVRSASGEMWFGGGSSTANTQGIGFINPSGEVSSFPLTAEAVDSPEPTLALPNGNVYYVTGDNLERLDRVTPTGAQSVLLKTHTQLGVVATAGEIVWVVAQSEKAGLGYHYYKPGALYRVDANGATTKFLLSGRFKLTDVQLGLGGVPWGIANGYTEKDLHLVSIEANGTVARHAAFNRTGVPVSLYAAGTSSMWLVLARGQSYELARVTR